MILWLAMRNFTMTCQKRKIKTQISHQSHLCKPSLTLFTFFRGKYTRKQNKEFFILSSTGLYLIAIISLACAKRGSNTPSMWKFTFSIFKTSLIHSLVSTVSYSYNYILLVVSLRRKVPYDGSQAHAYYPSLTRSYVFKVWFVIMMVTTP